MGKGKQTEGGVFKSGQWRTLSRLRKDLVCSPPLVGW